MHSPESKNCALLILIYLTTCLTHSRYPIHIYQSKWHLIPLAFFIFALLGKEVSCPQGFCMGKLLMENLSLFVIDEASIKKHKVTQSEPRIYPGAQTKERDKFKVVQTNSGRTVYT